MPLPKLDGIFGRIPSGRTGVVAGAPVQAHTPREEEAWPAVLEDMAHLMVEWWEEHTPMEVLLVTVVAGELL